MTQLVDHCDVLVHEMSYGPLITDMDRKVLKQNVTNWKQIQKEQLEKEKNKQRWEDIKTRTRLWMHSRCGDGGNVCVVCACEEARGYAFQLAIRHKREFGAEDVLLNR